MEGHGDEHWIAADRRADAEARADFEAEQKEADAIAARFFGFARTLDKHVRQSAARSVESVVRDAGMEFLP